MLEAMMMAAKKAAAPVVGYGVYSGGFNDWSGAIVGTTHKYIFGTAVVSTTTAMVVARYQLGGVSNTEKGIWSGGWSQGNSQNPVTDVFTFSGETIAAGTNMSAGSRGAIGFGTATAAYFALGFTSAATTTTDRFAYANNARTSGGNLTTGRMGGAGTYNTTYGIMAGGYSDNSSTQIASVDKYTFANNTAAAGTSLGTARGDFAGAGETTRGYFAYASGVTKYTYATDVVAAATNLVTPANQRYGGATGNADMGIFMSAGYAVQKTEKYAYLTEAVSAGTTVGGTSATAKTRIAAFSSTPGGF